jgi:serine/threonine protein kinase
VRTKLFVSYSKGDAAWRDRFLRHLKTVLVLGEDLWVDLASLEPGAEWERQISEALAESRCALVLVTPNYLELGRFARTELARLIDEQQRGLVLLPVLVEHCAWSNEEALASLQFVRWQAQARLADSTRDELRALTEAGESAAVDRAVIEICEQVRRSLGLVGQTTREQRDRLFEDTRRVLGETVVLDESVHAGDYSVVYRGRLGTEPVAVKAVPDAPRQNRVRMLFDAALASLSKLRDPAFIRVRFAVVDREPHCLVMEYVDWPTLETVLAGHPGRRLPPRVVARLLSVIARAQGDAHRHGMQVGPLSPASIHVNDAWDVRLSPLRLEGQLARAAGMTTGPLLNWDVLTHLAPEVSEGRHPSTVEELDALEQYYLGLLGLELLLGRRPFEVHRFEDLAAKSRFFDDPRRFFGDSFPVEATWADECPALAFVLARLLARDPAERLPSAAEAAEELAAVADDLLPDSLRRQVEGDLEIVARSEFAAGFYEKLFEARPALRARFHDVHTQPRMLADALQDLVQFDPRHRRSRFLELARKHAGYGITAPDVEAFRRVFVQQVEEALPGSPARGDAWNAVLARGLRALSEHLAGR